MEFLNPAALYGLLALPLLLIPYLIRRKTRRVPFSSLLLLNEASAQLRTRPWGHLRLPLLFFLQLLLLALLVFALAEPVFTTLPSHVAIVLDNSASMQATEDGGTRFQLAQEKARSVLGGVAAGGQVDIYTTTPRLQRVAAASFSPREAAQAMNSLTPYDLGDPPVDYRSALARLAQANRYERVFLITDHPSRGQNEILRVTTVGTAKANLAMTSLRVRQPALANSSTEASFEVSNYSSKDERVRVLLRGGGKVLGSRELSVPAGKSAAGTVESLPSYPSYEAEIENRDALALDNRRFAVAPGSAKLRILAVSPRPQELATLKSVPGISLDVIAPDDYEKTEHSAYGLEIFHRTSLEKKGGRVIRRTAG